MEQTLERRGGNLHDKPINNRMGAQGPQGFDVTHGKNFKWGDGYTYVLDLEIMIEEHS